MCSVQVLSPFLHGDLQITFYEVFRWMEKFCITVPKPYDFVAYLEACVTLFFVKKVSAVWLSASAGATNIMPIALMSSYSPPWVDRVWDIWGSYYNMSKSMFYLLKGDYSYSFAWTFLSYKP